ncbi:uncharacterized protein L201_002042 [Kwoniella dendrophila CBS 6074]|uniref:CSC1/OSCA1-like 7TM region domain-containing protein n=1 Tax=Kwoniella dendrophila CBS 6074 TaxID=1295534 RepID=A0AAX4JQ32_9TREE
MTSTTTHDAIITPSPSSFTTPHQHDKRHYYLCGDKTLSWENEWYTAPFFISCRLSYDSAASTGPVNPPTGIYQDAPECKTILSSQLAQASSTIPATATSGQVVITTSISIFTSNDKTFASTILTTTTIPPTSLLSSTTNTVHATSTQSVSSISTLPGPTASLPASSITDPASINTCAGGWDWQDWGVVASLGSGIIVGGILWIIWGILRRKLPGIYAPRTWAVPLDSRPSKWTFLTFLLPFLNPPKQTHEGSSTLPVLYAGLTLSSLISLLALGGVLPMFLAGVPCLGETSPPNSLGGRLGTLTDLSLLRLLNALDPSPDSSVTTSTLNSIRVPVNPSKIRKIRSLSSTISPAISSARVRLIIILVILAILACGGGLFIIARTYYSLMRVKTKFENETCQGLEMVFMSAENVKGWKGMSEEGLRRWSKNWSNNSKSDNGEKEIDIVGLFAIPDTTELQEKVKERERVLEELEVAETNYISCFRLTQTASKSELVGHSSQEQSMLQPHISGFSTQPRPPVDFLGPRGLYRIHSVSHPESREKLNVPLPLNHPEVPTDSKFREINRDSVLFGGRFDIGQRIKMYNEGNWVVDPSPQSEETSPLDATPESSEEGPLEDVVPDLEQQASLPTISSPTSPGRPISPTSPQSPKIRAPARPRIPTRSSHRVSGEGSSPLAAYYKAIRDFRAKFKELNDEIEERQRNKFKEITSVDSTVKGWIVVGKGIRWLPFAELIEGYTREDIMWNNTGSNNQNDERKFWCKIAGLGAIFSIILIPFLGLTVGAAPGFSHYLGLMVPLAKSDGFASGVVEGLVPAVILATTISVIVYSTEYLSRRVKCISRSRQDSLAYKAVFYLLLFLTVIWTVLVVSLEYAVQGFASNVQQGRTVGDGAVFSTWFVFVLLLNLAFILPALHLLQGGKLFNYIKKKKSATTPRQRYRLHQQTSYSPAIAMIPCLIAVFYTSSLLFIFPLLALPIIVLLYLSFIANRYMIEYVFIDSSAGHSNTVLALWTIRRFGWTLSIQPLLYGFILLSRNEWAIGGISIGIAFITVLISEGLTELRYRERRKSDLSIKTQKALKEMEVMMRSDTNAIPSSSESSNTARPSRQSDLSIFNRITDLLPGYSRLPEDFPLPIETEIVNDLYQTESASYLKPSFSSSSSSAVIQDRNGDRYFTENLNSIRGLIYPLEMISPVPIIWLPNDKYGIAQGELYELGKYHNLIAIIDPSEQPQESKKKGYKGKERELSRLEAKQNFKKGGFQ